VEKVNVREWTFSTEGKADTPLSLEEALACQL